MFYYLPLCPILITSFYYAFDFVVVSYFQRRWIFFRWFLFLFHIVACVMLSILFFFPLELNMNERTNERSRGKTRMKSNKYLPNTKEIKYVIPYCALSICSFQFQCIWFMTFYWFYRLFFYPSTFSASFDRARVVGCFFSFLLHVVAWIHWNMKIVMNPTD